MEDDCGTVYSSKRRCQKRLKRSEIYGLRFEEERELQKALKLSLREAESSQSKTKNIKPTPANTMQQSSPHSKTTSASTKAKISSPKSTTLHGLFNDSLPLCYNLYSDDEELHSTSSNTDDFGSQRKKKTLKKKRQKKSNKPHAVKVPPVKNAKKKPKNTTIKDVKENPAVLSDDSISSLSPISTEKLAFDKIAKKLRNKYKGKSIARLNEETSQTTESSDESSQSIDICTVSNDNEDDDEDDDDDDDDGTTSQQSCNFQVQRKFAQNQSPLKSKNNKSTALSVDGALTEEMNTPQTEDFLLYLCLRRSALLPKELECFNSPWTPQKSIQKGKTMKRKQDISKDLT